MAKPNEQIAVPRGDRRGDEFQVGMLGRDAAQQSHF